MTKLEVAREMKDVISGKSSFTWIGIEKIQKGWKTYLSMNNPYMQMNFNHSCNEISIKECIEMLDSAIINGLQSR